MILIKKNIKQMKKVYVVTLLDIDGNVENNQLFGVFDSLEAFKKAKKKMEKEIDSDVSDEDFDISTVELNKCNLI